MYGILFVCTGNICRSPTAEGIFRMHAARAGLAGRLRIDSAGTHDYHIGEPPDPRSQRAAKTRGADIAGLRARQLDADDFRRFDLILTMDAYNGQCVERIRPPDATGRVLPFLHYAPGLGAAEVPDPFYGGPEGFEHVLDLIEAASAGLVAELRRVLADERGAASVSTWIWVALGSALGGVGRYGCGIAAAGLWGTAFPWGTLIVNVAGSFVIGFAGSLTHADGHLLLTPDQRAFVLIGLCGGFTTFSSFSLQTMALMQSGDWLPAGANVVGSVVLCLVAVWLGYLAATALGVRGG